MTDDELDAALIHLERLVHVVHEHRSRPHWRGSKVTDRIIGSTHATHRKYLTWQRMTA